jgi:hypothetical protein
MINFDNILYTPLDIPLLPFSNRSQIIDLYQTHATSIEKPTDPNLPVFWKGITCYKGPSFTPEMLLHVGTFIDMADLFKEEIDIMNNHLPLEVETISLWTNVQYVPPHRDKKVYDTRLDFRFRFVIAQEKKSFFIEYENKKRYIDLPDTTNMFCFNNQSCTHGGSFDESNFKILGVIRGKINDEQKLSNLLENSIQKYKDTCYTQDNYFG